PVPRLISVDAFQRALPAGTAQGSLDFASQRHRLLGAPRRKNAGVDQQMPVLAMYQGPVPKPVHDARGIGGRQDLLEGVGFAGLLYTRRSGQEVNIVIAQYAGGTLAESHDRAQGA